jgi:small subunit ribosomal protein S1
MGVDKKMKAITLSIKAKDQEEEVSAMKGYTQQASSAMPTLGDIFKEQMENK